MDTTRVVTIYVPHIIVRYFVNTLCKIKKIVKIYSANVNFFVLKVYDYKSKKSRVVFGPDLVMLGPDEQFTQLRYGK